MPDLAELVRDELRAQASTIDTPDDLDGRTHDRIDRRLRRRRAAGGGVLAVLVLAVVAAAVVLPDGRSATVTGPVQEADGPLYMVPGWLPDGFTRTAADGLAEDLPPLRDLTEEGSEVYVQFGSSGHAVTTLTLQWGLEPEGPEPLGDPVQVGGTTGLVADGVLTWQGHERLMRLSGLLYTVAGPEPAPVTVLANIAAAVDLGEAGYPVVTGAFEGTGAMPEGPSEGVGDRWVTYEDGEGRSIRVEVADAVEVAPLAGVDGTLTRRHVVRGHAGALLFGEPPATPGPGPDGHLVWEERPRTQVRVTTQGIAEADILRVAEQLTVVDEATWRSDVLGEADGTTTTSEVVETTTTTVATTSTTTPTTTAAPGAAATTGGPDVVVMPLVGTYSGTEHYSLGSEECPELDHVYDATLTDDTGAEWAFHEDYCGGIDADDMWSGGGTFTLTDPAGDEVTGTFTSRADADGPGEPYDLAVTGGTGRYEGATGECTADNHVERVTLGTQLQSGELACTIGVPGSS